MCACCELLELMPPCMLVSCGSTFFGNMSHPSSDLFAAQEWTQSVVKAWLVKDSSTLLSKLRAAERLRVDASILSASGAGFVLNTDRVWGSLPEPWPSKRQALLASWKNLSKKRGYNNDQVAHPFAGLKAATFEAAVETMQKFFHSHEGSPHICSWHFEAALLLVAQGFQDSSHLVGVRSQDVAKLSANPKVRALMVSAVEELNLPKQPANGTLAAGQASAVSGEIVAKNLVSVQVEHPGPLPDGGPLLMCKSLARLPKQDMREHLHAGLASLKLQTRKGSLKSVASGLRLWHVFATTVLGYDEDASLPPKTETDICLFVSIFRNPGTARNYVGHVKWACLYLALPVAWHGSEVSMTMQGLSKQYQSARAGALSRRRLMSEDLLLRLLIMADGISLFLLLGDLLLISWQALLRVQSEAIPLECGSFETVHVLPPNRHSSVFIDEEGTLHLRLRQRKHRPQGSLLIRPCICTLSQRNVMCVGHRLKTRILNMAEGQKVFNFTSSVALTQFRSMLKLLQVPDYQGFSFKCLRAGKAATLARQGHSLFQVMQSGEWRSSAVLAYADEDEFDRAAFLHTACDSSCSETEQT